MGHDHAPANYGRAFAVGVTLNLGFVIAEVIYGRRSHSLALVADAGHNMSDVLGLVLAWGAMFLARRHPTPERTYGFRRSSILAALINAAVLLISVGAIAWEAIRRISENHAVEEKAVIWVASVGILINAGTALMFMRGRKGDLNIRGAFLHMAADAVIALGVVITGFIMLYTGWLWLDPVASLVIVALVVYGTWGLLRDSVNLALDAVPEGVDIEGINEYLASFSTCVEVHDLHIWGMSTTETALTAHLAWGRRSVTTPSSRASRASCTTASASSTPLCRSRAATRCIRVAVAWCPNGSFDRTGTIAV
ncbi:MAG: cobalt-zinc-cadmium efflux system protein [Acidobacteriota bacterium]|jgi:cobalt-zinc-cadmium efflux system protein|nr:cobalt-zinc-cadmium efflux system protein [Acidobacteriota bacterium]